MTKLFFQRYIFSQRAGSLVKILSFICIFATFFGLSALVIVTSVMNGLNRNVKQRLLRFEPHLVVQSSQLNYEKSDQLEKIVKAIQPEAQIYKYEKQDMIIRTLDGLFHTVEAVGLSDHSDHFLHKEVFEQLKKSGVKVNTSEEELKENEIYIGQDLAFQLSLFEGSELLMIPPETLLLPKDQIPNYRRMIVKKVLLTEISKIDSQTIFYSVNGLMTKGMSIEKGWELRLPNPQKAENVQKVLNKNGFDAQTWIDRNGTLFAALKMEKIAMTVFLGFSALITSFIIFSVLTLLIIQKKSEMGLLMSLGMSRLKVRILFIKLGLLLSFSGMLSGILFGVFISLMIDWFPIPVLPDIYYDRSFPAKVDFQFVFIIFLGAVVISVLSSLISTRLLKNLNASESLRSI